MTTLPIKRIILYKHGVGYFERRGEVQGETLRLSFPRDAMDDVLKSLIALDLSSGQVRSLDFETPEDREELMAKGSIHLSDTNSLRDLLRDLRGRDVCCILSTPVQNESNLEGLVVGVDYEKKNPNYPATLSLYTQHNHTVTPIPLDHIARIELRDSTADADLTYFLRASQNEADRRSATLHLSPGDHDLLVGYIAPAPSWRVSYRLMVEMQQDNQSDDDSCEVLFQGWGLFDNQLEEDLEQITLTLVAGMPVSFRYRLYEPDTPERPLIEDEERTVNAPVFFEAAAPPAPSAKAARSRAMADEIAMSPASFGMAQEREEATLGISNRETFSIGDMEQTVQSVATGGERGALFAYAVSHPVSVARGQSAMVPILSQRLDCRRDLLYNPHKMPKHPVVSLRFTNETNLTLERGPVTVLEDGDYAGEAVIPFTRTDNEVIVPYAVELGIKVREDYHNERHIASISLQNEYLFYQEYAVRQTTYEITSMLSNQVAIVVEHQRRPGHELVETDTPTEETSTTARWSVDCAPNARTTFVVRERKMETRHEHVRSVTASQLKGYLKNRFLDEPTIQGLQGVLQMYRKLDDTRENLRAIDKERDAIYKKQKQIQGNLAPLDSKGEEGVLRKRYVAELNQQEDRLAEIAKEEQTYKQQITAWEKEAMEQLAKLRKKQEE
jgi:hypothetical protein